MKSILGLGLLLLVLVLLLHFEASLPPERTLSAPGKTLDLLCFSRGALLPPIENALTELYPMDDGIIAGERVLRFGDDQTGLRMAAFDETNRLIAHHNFDPARTPNALDALEEMLRSLPMRSLATFHHAGTIALPEDSPPEERDRYRRLLIELGAQARPDRIPNSSWAMVAMKTPDRWIKLAETFSSRQGVTLSFSADSNRDRFEGSYEGDFVVMDESRDSQIDLVRALAMAEPAGKTWQVQLGVAADEERMPSLSAIFFHGSKEEGRRENRLVWKRVRLGAKPRFTCGLGFSVKPAPPWPELVYSLLVNGKTIKTETLRAAAGRAPAWTLWDVDLARHAGATVSVELKAEQVGGTTPGRAFFGNPTLSWKEDALYCFFVAGHVYGHPEADDNDLHPAFTAKRDLIDQEPDLRFGFFTGDIVRKSTDDAWDAVDRFVASLPVPIYFAPGNHDLTERALYESRYGKTYFSFMHQGDLFIVLDPNLDQWNISGAQLTFLQSVLEQHGIADNIFVFFHQVLWVKKDDYFRRFIPNSVMGKTKKINYWTEVEPLFRNLDNPVYLFAGDVGAFPLGREILYHAYDNIHCIASGMGGGERDNFVLAKVHDDKSVTLQVMALNNDDPYSLGRVEEHQVER